MSERKILIAGGGIGGLVAAASLLQAGHDVEIYEQAPALGEVGAGIQLSANPMRVLRHLGVLEQVRARGYCAASYDFKLFDTGEILQRIPLGAGYEARHGVPYCSIHRADLLDVLIDRVRALKPDAVTLNARASGYEEDADGVTLLLTDGRRIRGDALVAADGIKSVIRAQMLGATPVTYTGDQSWRVMVPSERLAGQPPQETIDIYVGPGKHGVVYPIRRGELVNMVGSVEYENVDVESWTSRRPWTELKSDFAGWNPTVQAIIDHTDRDECYRWAMNNRPPVTNWSGARTTLLGDAAHPTLPYMAQGGAMAIEDGLILARAIGQEPDVTEALQLYQRNRIERTTRIVNESSANRSLFHLPSSAALRDAFAKRNLDGERNAWLFSYDATTVPLV
jgi:salicylate hydroxylase